MCATPSARPERSPTYPNLVNSLVLRHARETRRITVHGWPRQRPSLCASPSMQPWLTVHEVLANLRPKQACSASNGGAYLARSRCSTVRASAVPPFLPRHCQAHTSLYISTRRLPNLGAPISACPASTTLASSPSRESAVTPQLLPLVLRHAIPQLVVPLPVEPRHLPLPALEPESHVLV